MKLLVIGGTKLEKTILESFKSDTITLIGSFEKHPNIDGVNIIDGIFEPENPIPIDGYDLILDISAFNKIKFHVSKTA